MPTSKIPDALNAALETHCRQQGIVTDEAQQLAFRTMVAFFGDALADDLLSRLKRRLGLDRRPRCLYVWGRVGRGKTMLMDVAYEALGAQQKRRVHFHDLIREIRDRLAVTTGVNPMRRVALEISPPGSILCIDEVHVSDLDNAMLLEIFLREIIRNRLVLVSTSNYAPQDLVPFSLERMGVGESAPLVQASRAQILAMIDHYFQVLELGGAQDFRSVLGNRDHRGRYLKGDAAETHRRLCEQHGDPAPCVLQVYGRSLPVRAHRDGLLWVSFTDICEGLYSYRDYLQLVSDIRCIVLSDVRILNVDAAKRFSWLIEIAYDRQLSLQITSRVPQHMLFNGLNVPSSMTIEHDRVLSRLRQMAPEETLANT
ncbi:MAG: cell division protein ZapE [Pseudomonadota bacterium]